MTIPLDAFTVMAEQGYPVGARAKSKMSYPRHTYCLWGIVTANDGKSFTVKWDFIGESDVYDLATEKQRHEEACASFKRELDDIDPINKALASFGGSADPGHAFPQGGTPEERREREWKFQAWLCKHWD